MRVSARRRAVLDHVVTERNASSQQLVVQFLRPPWWELAVEKRAHFGLANVEKFRQRFDVKAYSF